MTRTFVVFLALWFTPYALIAKAQNFSIKEDGSVKFVVSTTGITRLSVVDDRVRQIVNDGRASAFEFQNDETTGDIFMRYVGADDDMPKPETGFVVTEKGLTFSYSMAPSKKTPLSVIVKLARTHTEKDVDSSKEAFSTSLSGSSDSTNVHRLVEATRETIRSGVKSSTPRGANGTVLFTKRFGDLVGTLSVAAAGSKGRSVREQDFYKKGVLAVWIQKRALAPRERSYVVTVRKR